jgi:mannose-1-phosphate guanylyltransferase/mannose-6-phosphate isomerase
LPTGPGTAKVKKLVENLKAKGRPEATEHRRNYRPWGYYQSIDQGSHIDGGR